MYTIREIQNRLLTKQISCTELTKLYLDAAAADTLNAYITSTPELALAAAGAVDRKIAAGESLRPLEGVPVCVKDNIIAIRNVVFVHSHTFEVIFTVNSNTNLCIRSIAK